MVLGPNSKASGGAFKTTDTNDASLAIYFTGLGARLIAPKDAGTARYG